MFRKLRVAADNHLARYGILPYLITMTIQQTARLEARLPVEVHALLKQAAELQGRTLTDFVVTAARDAALATIEEALVVRLSAEDQRRLTDALLDPPEPSPALRHAFDHHRRLVGDSPA